MSSKVIVTTTINGEEFEFLCEPRQSLLEVLRDVLGFTGAKEGCNNGNCGACNVLLDGVLVNSCLVLGVEAEGRTIETIEGMAVGGRLHPLQQKFLDMQPCSAASARPVFCWRPKRCSITIPTQRRRRCATGSPATSAAAPATIRSYALSSMRRMRCKFRP